MKIVITGASGGLGRFFCDKLQGHDVYRLCNKNKLDGYTSIDLRNWEEVNEYFIEIKPDIIIHCVSWIDVDACEYFYDKAFDLNVLTTYHMRKVATIISAKLVYLSTNDIFDGKIGMYKEIDKPFPINVYSKTKSYTFKAK